MWMTLRAESGEFEKVELDGPGGNFCFSVGSPEGLRSGIWVVQANERNSDVYITNLAIANFQKVSLHASNNWRFALTSEYASQVVPKGADRAMSKWKRPDEVAVGWTEAVSIWVTHEDLSTYTGLPIPTDPFFRDACRSNDEIRWIPPPGAGNVCGFHVLIARPDLREVRIEADPIGGFWLKNQGGKPEVCLVLVSHRSMSTDDYAKLKSSREAALTAASGASNDLDPRTTRGYLFGKGLRDVPSFWDIGVQPYS